MQYGVSKKKMANGYTVSGWLIVCLIMMIETFGLKSGKFEVTDVADGMSDNSSIAEVFVPCFRWA